MSFDILTTGQCKTHSKNHNNNQKSKTELKDGGHRPYPSNRFFLFSFYYASGSMPRPFNNRCYTSSRDIIFGFFPLFLFNRHKRSKVDAAFPLHPHRATFPARDPSSPTITSNHAPGDISCGIQTNDNSNAATAYLSNSAASFVT